MYDGTRRKVHHLENLLSVCFLHDPLVFPSSQPAVPGTVHWRHRFLLLLSLSCSELWLLCIPSDACFCLLENFTRPFYFRIILIRHHYGRTSNSIVRQKERCAHLSHSISMSDVIDFPKFYTGRDKPLQARWCFHCIFTFSDGSFESNAKSHRVR